MLLPLRDVPPVVVEGWDFEKAVEEDAFDEGGRTHMALLGVVVCAVVVLREGGGGAGGEVAALACLLWFVNRYGKA